MFDLTSLLTSLDSLQIKLFTWRRGTLIGTDSYGNRYYRGTRKRTDGRERRWVMYSGEFDPSKVPPEWFGWLHYTSDEPLTAGSAFHKPWVKPHEANPTGTEAAYRPPGHPSKGGQRARATGDYEPWQPA
jgi:NADH:ubiquinone oxidoreductase subunit